jgi:hypothetical protein
MQGGDRTAEVAARCYRLDVSYVSISIYGVILTPTPRTGRSAVLLLECKMYLKKLTFTLITMQPLNVLII